MNLSTVLPTTPIEKPRPQIACGCCGAMATHRTATVGGWNFYLCRSHAGDKVEDIVRDEGARYGLKAADVEKMLAEIQAG